MAKFFDKDFLGMYLVKKIFMGADEAALTFVSQLCIEEAIGERICEDSALGSGRCRESLRGHTGSEYMRLCRRQQISWAI